MIQTPNKPAVKRRRAIREPLKALGLAMVESIHGQNADLNAAYMHFLGDVEGARVAVAVLAKSWRELEAAMRAARENVKWAYGGGEPRVSLDDLAEMLAYDADRVREGLFTGLDKNVVRLVFRDKTFRCPACGTQHKGG